MVVAIRIHVLVQTAGQWPILDVETKSQIKNIRRRMSCVWLETVIHIKVPFVPHSFLYCFLFPPLKTALKKKRFYTTMSEAKIAGCGWWVSKMALHKMHQMVARSTWWDTYCKVRVAVMHKYIWPGKYSTAPRIILPAVLTHLSKQTVEWGPLNSETEYTIACSDARCHHVTS
jgi:hypothetical protein